jgi:hypothetical protein
MTTTPGVTGTPSGSTIIQGHVVWQGRPAQPNPLQQLPVTVTLKSGVLEFNYPAQTTDANGSFTLDTGSIPFGNYQWLVKNPQFLANTGNVTLSGNNTNVDMGLMRAGDANNDNNVNIVDFALLKASYGMSVGDPGYDARADFTGDNVVSLPDFNWIKVNFGTSGETSARR